MHLRIRHLRWSAAIFLSIGAVAVLPSGCDQSDPNPSVGAVGAEGWLDGDLRTQLETVAAHLGGMGGAMMQIGDRYIDLHWAGENENWNLALHQIEEIEEILERALIRRPQYARPSEMFLQGALPALQEAAEAEDPDLFRQRFGDLTVNCNACHAMTGYAFVRITAPRDRTKPWHWPEE